MSYTLKFRRIANTHFFLWETRKRWKEESKGNGMWAQSERQLVHLVSLVLSEGKQYCTFREAGAWCIDTQGHLLHSPPIFICPISFCHIPKRKKRHFIAAGSCSPTCLLILPVTGFHEENQKSATCTLHFGHFS